MGHRVLHRRLRGGRVRLLLLLALLVVGLPLLYGWYAATPYEQARRLAAARARWAARPFERYTLRYHTVGPASTQEPGQESRSVHSFFRQIERYPHGSQDFRCGGLNFECTRPVAYRARASYDAQLGYPREIMLERTRHPDWFNLTFWRWLFTSGQWRSCENLLCTSTSRTTIRITTLTPHKEEETP